MGYESDEILYIKAEELHVLLAGLGRENWYGLTWLSREHLPSSDRDINEVLTRLSLTGIISWDGRRVVLDEKWEPVFRILLSARNCILTCSRPDEPIRSVYFGSGGAVVIEPSRHDAGMFQVARRKKTEWLQDIEECGMIPSEGMDESGENLDLPQPAMSAPIRECCAYPEVYSVFQKIRIDDGECVARLMTCEKGLGAYLLIQDEGAEKIELCSQEALKRCLIPWMR